MQHATQLIRGNPITVQHLPFNDRREAADRRRLAGRRERLDDEELEADKEGADGDDGVPASNGKGGSFKDQVSALEHQPITEALDRAGGNRSKAAEELGIYRRLLYAKIKEYGLGE